METPPPDSDNQPPATSTTGRRYKIGEVQGKGAFGTVYKAEYLGEGGFTRKVALKVLNPDREGFADLAERLRDEARLLGLLRHRAIVHVDGLVNLEGRWTVVMEFIEGVDLQRIVLGGAMPIGPALEGGGEVAGALHVAYWPRRKDDNEPLRLLHRDIKPSNIILTPAGEVKVVDFGVARAEFVARESSTQSTRFGSLAYMSPERLELIDSPSGDLYALGAVFYELVAGKPLGRTSVHPQRHAKHVNEAIRALSRKKTNLNASLLGFMASMLEYEPEKRPSARDVESRCREFRSTVGSTWLREWAEANVPPLLKGAQRFRDPDLSDVVVSEAVDDRPDDIPTEFLKVQEPESSGPNPTIVYSEELFEPELEEDYDPTGESLGDVRLPLEGIEPSDVDPRELSGQHVVIHQVKRGRLERLLVIAVGILLVPIVGYLIAWVLFNLTWD